MKKTFKGSYGQVFSIETYTKESTNRLREISKDVFSELMAYFLAEAVYQESDELSEKAKAILEELSASTINKLLSRLREPLKDIHKVNKAFGYPVTIRYRKKLMNHQQYCRNSIRQPMKLWMQYKLLKLLI